MPETSNNSPAIKLCAQRFSARKLNFKRFSFINIFSSFDDVNSVLCESTEKTSDIELKL